MKDAKNMIIFTKESLLKLKHMKQKIAICFDFNWS